MNIYYFIREYLLNSAVEQFEVIISSFSTDSILERGFTLLNDS